MSSQSMSAPRLLYEWFSSQKAGRVVPVLKITDKLDFGFEVDAEFVVDGSLDYLADIIEFLG